MQPPALKPSPKILRRSAFDGKHVKSVSAYVLAYNGEMAGKIVANWSDNPAGSVCTASVYVYRGPLAELPATTGRAGGYGYCKFSAAVADALSRVLVDYPQDMHGRGESAVEDWFRQYGYVVYRVI